MPTLSQTIATYEANPTEANAQKVVKHVNKHPMACCFLDPSEAAIAQQAALSVSRKTNNNESFAHSTIG